MDKYQAGCTGKIQYTQKQAKDQLKLRRRDRHKYRDAVQGSIYKCRWCGSWHLSHYSPGKWSKIKKRVRRGAPELPDIM